MFRAEMPTNQSQTLRVCCLKTGSLAAQPESHTGHHTSQSPLSSGQDESYYLVNLPEGQLHGGVSSKPEPPIDI
jgi:hypothetical protein